MATDDARGELFKMLYADRWFAHEWLFEKRHAQKSPPFHHEMVADWHGKQRRILHMVFRGGAKSSRAEEAIIIKERFKEFKYGLIVSSSLDLAAQRLHAIRYEYEQNERLDAIFGNPIGPIWGAEQLMTSQDVLIQAMGKGQSLRGRKHLDQRPDLLLVDDLEEYNDVRTEKAREETLRWFNFDLLPALDPNAKIIVLATPLDRHALPMELRYTGLWKSRKIPWYYYDKTGSKVASWPERFPLEVIEAKEDEAQRAGQMRSYRAEYLCEAEAPEDKPFKAEMFRIVPRVRTWQPVYCMFDPARTTKSASAMTGFAAWTWEGPKLIVWDSWQRPLMPNEIIQAIFDAQEDFSPVVLGFEEDGLNEWAMQPIRQAQTDRRITLPIEAQKAPPGKIDFIKALQPYFHAREVEFAQPLPELEKALEGFPSGKIDAPNALAYALKMRPGLSVYTAFGSLNVAEDLAPTTSETAWLCVNATRTLTVGVLAQFLDGALRVYADWVSEGEASQALEAIVSQANQVAGQGVRVSAGPLHFDRWNNVGVTQAADRFGARVTPTVSPEQGRVVLRDLLQREVRGVPMVVVSMRARWCLNGFMGGYCYPITKQGLPASYPKEGRYRVVMEALESFCGLSQARSTGEGEYVTNAVTPGGQAYRSALVRR